MSGMGSGVVDCCLSPATTELEKEELELSEVCRGVDMGRYQVDL